MRSTVSLELLRVFHAVASGRSFTRAGETLGRDKSRLSRAVRELEREMGAELLVRTTRSVTLTREGRELFEAITPALARLDQAMASVPSRASIPSGEVTITAPFDLARAVLAPLLVSFRAQQPLVRVRVEPSNELRALGPNVDLAVRVGKPGAESLVARRVGELRAAFFASPAYLERRGVPASLEALAEHDGLWPLPTKGQRSFAPGRAPPTPALECQDFGVLEEHAVAGGGIALLPLFLAARRVAAGSLVRVFPRFELGGAPVFVVSRAPRVLSSRVAALRAFLLERLELS